MATSRHAELNSFQQSWGGDLGGAFLVTRANKDYPAYIKTPKGMEVEEGYCIQAVGNLYGFPPAGQNFSI